MTSKDHKTAAAEKVFVSWSGGKDSCYACYKAIQSGLEVRYLASMLTRNTGRLFPHYVTAEVLRGQAEAIGIPLFEQWLEVPETVTQNIRFVDYDIKYVEMLQKLKALGITGGVFGDVSHGNPFAKAHWDRVEDFCRPVGMKPYRPLWDQDRELMIRNFIDLGFKPLVIVADNRLPELLGRILDHQILDDLKSRYDRSKEQERIYYHTFVIDGPMFKQTLEITEAEKVVAGGISYLDMKAFRLTPKTP
jgi:uncharacterized protein (TIGR00290 family)